MKVSVIGANSYIARNIIYILKQFPQKYKLSLYDKSEEQLDSLDSYKSIDILSRNSVKYIDFSCDIIFMFVGKTGSMQGFAEYDSFININERALLNVLNEYKVQKSNAKIIFPSTRLVYKGRSGKLKENAEKEFKTIYAINKYSCEQYLEMYNRVYNVRYCIFRICLPYGTLIANASSYGTAEFFLSRAKSNENITLYGDGNQRRTLTYIGDLCNILIKGAMSERCINDVYNIGGEDYSLYDMANLIAKLYKVNIELIEWPEVAKLIESGDTVFDSEKLDKIIDYKSKMKFASWISEFN
ncbi:NAD-dependent epimerase/dehydratase family protein [Clostridium tyrobutyricum]|uniref:NAD-dependent epimerase/dehydratase family protein n=1 Tax=Clostridium tyrobutyricum TaxID=1519 RepID=UPI0020123510|nr:NAD(P)-dependent oxidoreductase [Clostridium tyrobutyricum]MBR9647306.1 NAD(P)-dependent oxidoreductase [Clostridium tyrobutyricum]